jgi:hypothetical protein
MENDDVVVDTIWDARLRELARSCVDAVNRAGLRDEDLDVFEVEVTLTLKARGKNGEEKRFSEVARGDGDSLAPLGQFALGYDR